MNIPGHAVGTAKGVVKKVGIFFGAKSTIYKMNKAYIVGSCVGSSQIPMK